MLSNQEGTSFQGRKLGRFHGFSFIVLHASHRLESCWRSPWLLPLASRVSSPDILECRDEFVTQRWRGMGQRRCTEGCLKPAGHHILLLSLRLLFFPSAIIKSTL